MTVVVLSGGSNVACARLHLLVAAPRRHEAAVLATPSAHELARLGFEVKVGEAGITLTRQTADAAIMTEPILGWVIGASAAAARG